MSDQVAAGDFPSEAECGRCGAKFDWLEDLKGLMDDGVQVLDDGVIYCRTCMTEISLSKKKKDMDKVKGDMLAVLERMDEGKGHEGHEKMVEEIVEAMRNKEYRKQEYTYDVSVLCLSLALLAETELKRLNMRMSKFAEDEDKEYSVLVGRFEGLRAGLSAWMSDANEVFSDFTMYSSSKSVLHRLDDDDD